MARRPKYQREKDLAELARRYLRGEHQADIAADLGVSQATISIDLKTLQRRWQESALVDIDEAKARELARVDNLEWEYWNAWERSCSERKVASAEVRAGDVQGKPHKSSVRKEQRDGNPAFLRGIEWCIDKRCRILGLDAPTRSELSGPDGGAINVDFTGSELDAEIIRILDVARAREAVEAASTA